MKREEKGQYFKVDMEGHVSKFRKLFEMTLNYLKFRMNEGDRIEGFNAVSEFIAYKISWIPHKD